MGLKITNAANGRNPILSLYGVIGDEYGGVSANEVQSALMDLPTAQDIDVHIHSEGGSYTDSVAIHSLLRSRSGKVNVHVDGLAASGGSVIAMAGTTIEMANGAWLMIHESHAMPATSKKADEFRQIASMLDAINNQLFAAYKPRWNGTEANLRAALSKDTWFCASDAIAHGLADRITGSLALAAHYDTNVFHYNNVPHEVAYALQNAFNSYDERLVDAFGSD